MIPIPAQYLLRFDDLCPTMDHSKWERYARLVREFNIKPLLAIVPDNRDPELDVSSSDPAFWQRMSALEASGATIALHGYQHKCTSSGKGYFQLHNRSEFSGVAEDTQRQWISAGVEILRNHNLHPRLWVAPRHGFDKLTLNALRTEKILMLSDGFSRIPYMRENMLWFPQQLWEPVYKKKGLWTICIHTNIAPDNLWNKLYTFLQKYHLQFTSVERVVREFPKKNYSNTEYIHERYAMKRMQLSKMKSHIYQALLRVISR